MKRLFILLAVLVLAGGSVVALQAERRSMAHDLTFALIDQHQEAEANSLYFTGRVGDQWAPQGTITMKLPIPNTIREIELLGEDPTSQCTQTTDASYVVIECVTHRSDAQLQVRGRPGPHTNPYTPVAYSDDGTGIIYAEPEVQWLENVEYQDFPLTVK